MDKVVLATMLPGASKVDDMNLNPTWKSPVYTDNGVKTAFVKLVEPRKIFVECACAILGRALGLPMPSPMVVKVTHDALPEVVAKGESKIAFGSEDVGHPSFRRRINDSSAEAMDLLGQYVQLLEISVFDEWIANHDRNIGNILFDGKIFSFIDHELALPSVMTDSSSACDNQLLRVFFSNKCEFEQHKASKSVNTRILPGYTVLELNEIVDNTLAVKYFNAKDSSEVVKVLAKRIDQLIPLVHNRIGFKQQGIAI
ncbi:hypothetical protein BCT30_05030 [Enterovibrio norvegicus]|uniref:HipA family kinase n=1 Tax=Enterovibrio norvegicus TaxID=188144 RepID=UPI000C83A036|nr:HipA family kinase [Enterovibrio norvegicus]PMI33536.1 hypothetical protein BCU46_22340 [Enterovibrio norvegicus]PMN44263.1 hypothetical protein BCT30_05030 [Enterovibrio norvegicus]